MINKNKLKGRIVELYGTQDNFAKFINSTPQTITAKLSGHSRFTQDEIIAWANALKLENSDIVSYFFMPADFNKN